MEEEEEEEIPPAEDVPAPRIRPLDPDIVKQIAAGEVIHQPFNVVKELIENSIDAKSNQIAIILQDGGYKEVMIRDDGCGVHPDDTDKIANRFHSSKLQSVEDVYKVRTLGFRGEALSSMALIGKVTIVSRRSENDTGVRVVVKGKNRTKQVEHQIDPGTTIIVNDLFNNYTTSDVNKSNYRITKLCQDYAAANPGLKLILQTPKLAFKTPITSTTNQKEWIGGVLGTKKLFEKHIKSHNPPFTVSLFGVHLKEAKLSLKAPKINLTCFVNRRLVTICSLESMLRDQLERTAFTCESVYAFFEIDPSLIDVHVSPTKEFVTIRNADAVLEVVAETFGKMIKDRHEESHLESSKSSTGVFPSASNHSQSSIFSPSTKQRFDLNQSLMDSFVEREDTAEYASQTIMTSSAPGKEYLEEGESEQLIFRHLPLYDTLLQELQENWDREWTKKLQKSQCMKINKIDGIVFLMFQYSTEFHFVPFQGILEEFFYQRIVVGFGNFNCVKDFNDTRISLKSLIMSILPDATETFIEAKLQTIFDSQAALDDFFSVTIQETDDGDLLLTGAPVLLPALSTPWSELALTLISLSEPYPDKEEANFEWVKNVSMKLSSAFAAPLFRYVNTGKELSTIEYWNSQILPIIKSIYMCGPQFTNFMFSGSNNDLYKSFDRC